MRNITLLSVFSVLGLILASTPAWAAPKKATTAAAIIGNNVQLPMIVTGGNQSITSKVDTDLMAAGGNVSVSSDVNGDAYVAGGQLTVSGNIAGDLVIAGGNITISGKIGKNLIVAGGQVRLEDKASVGGYMLAAGGQIDISGDYNGPVKVTGGSLIVREPTTINGNLEAYVGRAAIADKANIKGEKKITIRQVEVPQGTAEALRRLRATAIIVSFLGKLLTLLLLVRFLGNFIKPAEEMLKNYWGSLGWGLVVLIVTPIIGGILLATFIGAPLGLILMALYFILLYLSSLIAAAAVGNWMTERNWVRVDNIYLQAILGLLVISILGLIPAIGWLANLVFMLLGLGIAYKLIRGRYESSSSS